MTPQFQLKMRLNCSPTVIRTDVLGPFATMVQESFISTQEILYSPDVMYLNIIIVDENDNFPIFIHPNEKEQKIGYPEAELAHDVLPPYLFRVEV